jgi:hypothetical protein
MACQTFAEPPAVSSRQDHNSRLHRYLSDLVQPYDLTLRSAGAGHSYGEMAASLVTELVTPTRPVDVLVLAFAIPDVRPGRATATYLSEICPGSPLAFAICDQGAAAAFTGLRLVADYARTDDCERALLLVVEQSALPYDAGLPVAVPAGNTAVGLRCENVGTIEVGSVQQHADVGPGRAAELLAEALGQAVAGASQPDRVILIADPSLAGMAPAGVGQVRTAPADQPYTGIWWELAAVLGFQAHQTATATSRLTVPSCERVVVASYDRHLRYLCLSTIDHVPGRGGGGS